MSNTEQPAEREIQERIEAYAHRPMFEGKRPDPGFKSIGVSELARTIMKVPKHV